MARTIVSLFSGVGGLDLAARIAWPDARVLAYVEREAYAAACLLARMEEKTLEVAPVWCGEIEKLDWGCDLMRPDLLVAGFPCQDISSAGTREGIKGKRSGLWWEVHRAICSLQPTFVLLENVSAIVNRGLDVVLGSLAQVGFDAEWMCLRASDVGAPHKRDRWFCLAYSDGRRFPKFGPALTYVERSASGDEPVRRNVKKVEHAEFERLQGQARHEAPAKEGRKRKESEPARTGCDLPPEGTVGSGDVPDTECAEVWDESERGKGTTPTSKLWNTEFGHLGTFPPGPDDEAWEGLPPYLVPAIEPGFRVMADGVPMVVDESRADQIRCAGNAVVPLQAAAAFRHLLRRIGVE